MGDGTNGARGTLTQRSCAVADLKGTASAGKAASDNQAAARRGQLVCPATRSDWQVLVTRVLLAFDFRYLRTQSFFSSF